MQHTDFANQFINQMAEAFGISYEQLSRDFIPGPPIITARMLRLATSGDRRQFKRAWTLYLRANGRHAPRSYFSMKVGQANDLRWRQTAAVCMKPIYERWLDEAVQAGHLALPSTPKERTRT
ncbi:hypothetical protein SPHV1_100059 [Novosphingobium sp. KN65.2]|nr:hypothetical protein SPHV1_100059 [Novosphingobium sp. KN65.2]